jgi:hypothetical protein
MGRCEACMDRWVGRDGSWDLLPGLGVGVTQWVSRLLIPSHSFHIAVTLTPSTDPGLDNRPLPAMGRDDACMDLWVGREGSCELFPGLGGRSPICLLIGHNSFHIALGIETEVVELMYLYILVSHSQSRPLMGQN